MGVLVTSRKEVRESRKCDITRTTGSRTDQSEMGHVVPLRSSAFSRFLSTHPNHIRHALRIKQASRLRTSDSLRPPRLRCTRVHTRCDSHRQCVCQWIISPPIAPVDFRVPRWTVGGPGWPVIGQAYAPIARLARSRLDWNPTVRSHGE